MNKTYLRSLQVLGSLAVALTLCALDYALAAYAHELAPESLLFKIIEPIVIFLIMPGGLVAWLVGGGGHDLDFKLAQTLNVVIYTGLGYVFFRFLEWQKGRVRPK
jgi:hypothetical protein